MSALSALAPTAYPAAPRRAAAPRPVEVVPTRTQRRARPRSMHAIATVAGFFTILVAQLLLSIVLSDGAYRITALEAQTVELDRSAQVLTESLEALRSPQNLAANAEQLGMVANASPAYLRLADGLVLGAPVAAGAGAGVLQGRATMIGNVLLADVPLIDPASTGASTVVGSGVASTSSTSGSVPSPAAATGSIPTPVTR